MVNKQNVLEFLQFIGMAADEIRAVIEHHRREGFSVERKLDHSLVTSADQSAESRFRSLVSTHYPDHSILGEEFGYHATHSPFCWMVDPIDGTLSFAHGIPLYGSILSLSYQGDVITGLIDLPGIQMRLVAAKDCGAFLNGEPFQARYRSGPTWNRMAAIGDLKQFRKTGHLPVLDRLIGSFEYLRIYPDVFGHAMAITGAVDLMVDPGLKPWDESASGLIAREAGAGFAALNPRLGPDNLRRRDILIGDPDLVAAFANEMTIPALNGC